MQVKLINTVTTVFRNLVNVVIQTKYAVGSAISCYVAWSQDTLGINDIPGDGVFVFSGDSTVDFWIDNDGNLIVSDIVGDVNRFFIDSTSGILKEVV